MRDNVAQVLAECDWFDKSLMLPGEATNCSLLGCNLLWNNRSKKKRFALFLALPCF